MPIFVNQNTKSIMEIAEFTKQIFGIWVNGLILCLCLGTPCFAAYYCYRIIMKCCRRVCKTELRFQNAALLKDNQTLLLKIEELQDMIFRKDFYLFQNAALKNQFVQIGSLKIRSKSILYIASQSFDQLPAGNSRIKVIHYLNSDQKDYLYTTFDVLVEKLPEEFMMINKNILVNLNGIAKIQGNEIFLKNRKSSFLVSENKQAELELRLSNI